MGKVIDFSVERAIKEKRVDLQEISQGELQLYYKKKSIHTNTVIDFGWVRDEKLLKLLITFIFKQAKRNDLLPDGFHAIYAVLLILMPEANLDGTLNSFLSYCERHFQQGNKKTFWNVFKGFYKANEYEDPFDCDIWDLEPFNLAKDRKNPTNPITKISFEDIKREDTKVLIKRFTKYNLEVTGLSTRSVYAYLRNIIVLCNMIDKSPSDFTRKDAQDLLKKLKEIHSRAETFNEIVRCMIVFFDYLLEHDYVSTNPFFYGDTIKGKRKYIRNSVDWSVILQIFNCLDKFKNQTLVLMYLIVFCTGMRVSEVCQIKRNCLEKTTGGYFIRYYHQKMKKNVSNVIPENLFLLIQRYISNISDPSQEYLFVSPNATGPYRTGTYSSDINKELSAFNIKNPDGTPYRYRPHAYRHTMAKRMRELNIAYQFIQEQLHHESSDMTMAYVEFLDKEKIRKIDTFIDINGNLSPIKVEEKINEDEAFAEYMRKYINSQILPNGVCARPIKLGQCPHCNSCLTCPEFRTSVVDLPVHKQHLVRTENYIKIAEANGWVHQIATGMETKNNLNKIILKLEQLDTTVS